MATTQNKQCIDEVSYINYTFTLNYLATYIWSNQSSISNYFMLIATCIYMHTYIVISTVILNAIKSIQSKIK